MGRYYSGDIEGKFWFGVQSSNDADFFGVEGCEPSYIDYYFDEDNLPDIKAGIKKCKEALGDNKKKLDEFFKKNQMYNDEMLTKAGFTDIKELMKWYARLILGKKILKCVKAQGDCSFSAEC